MKNRVILVTGGAGFIGSHLVDRLIKEYPEKIIVVDNFFLGKKENLEEAKKEFDNLKIIQGDASDYELMKELLSKESVDIVYDLAIIPLPASLERPSLTFNVNIKIALTLIELLRQDFYTTLVHFSSSEAYGDLLYQPMNEKHPLYPKTPYAASKATQDHLLYSYYKTFGVDVRIIRPFNTYGPRQNEGSYAAVIPATIKRILNNETPIIFGDGKQTRDYLYVSDVVDASVKIYNINRCKGEIINIGSGKETSIFELIMEIVKIMKVEPIIKFGPERPGDVRRHFADISKARKIINFEPKTSLHEGLVKTVEWYKNKLGG